MDILRNKNLTTRFQILVEIASSGPNVQQRDIARKLEITPQAVSDYIAQLIKDGLLVAEGRSRYKITNEAVNWIIKELREINEYSSFIQQAVTNISICAAVAGDDLEEGQKVGLKMEDGLLYATAEIGPGATGIAVAAARRGDDIGVTRIEGIVSLKIGKVTILRVPGIQKGGSGAVAAAELKHAVRGRVMVGAIGIEAMVALKKIDFKPFYAYGVEDAAVEAARSGLSPAVVCVDDAAPALVGKLEAQGIDYELRDLRR